jgi:predicted Zn finger-like uncharacterized protein
MPIAVVCDVCRADYSLKDEYSGKKVRCKQCGNVLAVPEAAAEAAAPQAARGYDRAFARDKFLVNQKRLSINEKYYIFDEAKQPILFVERPAHLGRQLLTAFAAVAILIVGMILSVMAGIGLGSALGQTEMARIISALIIVLGMIGSVVLMVVVAIRLTPLRHVTIYADDSKTRPLLEILQDQKVSLIRATYTVNCPTEGNLGKFKKNYLYNFIRKRWEVLGPDGTVRMVAKEDSIILSLMRRLLGPAFGLLRTNFIIARPEDDKVIGEFNRKFTLFDRYVLDMSADRAHQLDRRVAVALGVMLDTGERR